MAKNTSILLGEYFENYVNEKISSGKFSSVSEVIRTALRLLENEENIFLVRDDKEEHKYDKKMLHKLDNILAKANLEFLPDVWGASIKTLPIKESREKFSLKLKGRWAVVEFEHHALEVQQDVDHVFLHAIDGRVLVQNAGDGDLSGGVTDHGGQQHAPKRVAQRMAIATLERLQGHLGLVVA